MITRQNPHPSESFNKLFLNATRVFLINYTEFIAFIQEYLKSVCDHVNDQETKKEFAGIRNVPDGSKLYLQYPAL